eukprot:scaffold1212_cov79-Skeletonema_dohrnii-CCMP3373.AAC.5
MPRGEAVRRDRTDDDVSNRLRIAIAEPASQPSSMHKYIHTDSRLSEKRVEERIFALSYNPYK